MRARRKESSRLATPAPRPQGNDSYSHEAQEDFGGLSPSRAPSLGSSDRHVHAHGAAPGDRRVPTAFGVGSGQLAGQKKRRLSPPLLLPSVSRRGWHPPTGCAPGTPSRPIQPPIANNDRIRNRRPVPESRRRPSEI